MNSIRFNLRKTINGLIVFSLSLLFGSQLTYAAALSGTSGAFDLLPPAIQAPDAKPIVMLAMSNDHQLFYKAYTDYDDIFDVTNGVPGEDGILDTTYTDEFDYYGYFDSRKCYNYVVNRFEPVSMAGGTNNHDCDDNGTAQYWSGNFLNWITMSRMDIVRKVLFGGKRFGTNAGAEETGITVLERAHIPSDNHAWSKYFPSTDLLKYTPYSSALHPNGLTFCNVTPRGTQEFSENNDQEPRLRIAQGQWPDWAAQEGEQCLWEGEDGFASNNGESPDDDINTEFKAELNVRVKVCDPSLLGTENCKNYGTAGTPIYKPIGLLHTYGENGAMDFGLISGSYEKGKSGGVLRKNISAFTDEINANGTFNTSTNGIISTINRLRISRYSYDDNGYGDSTVDNCPYGQNTWANGECSNWGNPMGEIYLEALRYYSGAGAGRAEFAANSDTTWIPGIATNVTWRDPYGALQAGPAGGGYEQCSKPNIITLSTGVLGFDHDEYTGAADVGGTLNVNTETNAIGDVELTAGNTYYIGSTTGGSANDVCSAQSISNLSTVTGLCPEAAGLQGSFKLAGLAYYAHKSTTDLRNTTSGNDISGTQNVNTYSIALAPPIPDIKVDVGGSEVRIIPVAHNWRDNNAMVLVNFQVISQTATTGEFFMNYENAPAGADHDSDFKGYLKYEVSGSTISITAHSTGSSAGSTMHLGYLIDGVTDPGIYYVASNRDVTNQDQIASNNYLTTQADIDSICGALTLPASGSFVRCSLYQDLSRLATNGEINSGNSRDLRGARTHTAGSSNSELLKSPMWYAAKWGNFNDLNNNNIPDLTAEWDIQDNNTGDYNPDGIPDSYYLVTNPQVLETQLSKTLNEILQRASSGTAAAVIADTVSMTGAVVQALYQPRLSLGGDLISWAGLVHSVFIDEYGNLREDTDQDGQLDAPGTDKYIQIKYSPDVGRTQIYECTSTNGGLNLTCPLANRKEVEELKSLWNVRNRLAEVPDSRITTQRSYTDPFLHSTSGGRHIITWLDDGDNLVESGEIVPFSYDNAGSTNINGSNFRYLNSNSESEAENIVNFIRGKEGISGFRSRTIDYDNDGTREAWRLGDIVHSTPLIVSQPSEKWDVVSGDDTYTAFRAQYANRRNVVYVGANDGMLHAINAGFFDVANNRFCRAADCSAQTDDTAHPLGAELWAYVPKNLLPHLRWLGEADYPHVYYMDGKAQAFDVNIFDADTDHPNGWGTILVAGMRLGGGDLPVDHNDDSTVDYTARSGYVILDITNPEVAPKVLGEFTHADLGYSTSTPTLVVKRQPDAANDWTQAGTGTLPNDWYLVFGSGPNVLSNVTSTQNAKLFMVKLALDSITDTLDFTTAGNVTILDTGNANSFVGDPASVDWSSDFLSDAVYFGIAGGTPSAPNGKLLRLKTAGNTASAWSGASLGTLIDSGQPFINKPELVSLDDSPYNQWWVYAGTGRLYINADNFSTAQQSFYGIKEAHDGTYPEDYPDTTFTVNTTDYTNTDYAQNVTGISVFSDASVTVPAALQSEFATVPTTFNQLETHIEGKKGWFLNYSTSPVATRSLTTATFWRNFVLFTSYSPPSDQCTPEGHSDLYALYGATGTAHPIAGLNLEGNLTNNGVADKLPSTYLSIGIASEITTYDTLQGTKPIIQMSTGEIVDTGTLTGLGIGEGRQSWRELPF